MYQRASDGRWVGAISVGRRNGKPVRKVVYGSTRKEAAGKLQALQAKALTGQLPKGGHVTLEAWFDWWIGTHLAESHRSERTVENTRWAADHINRHLGNVRLDRLTPPMIDDMIRSVARSGLAVSSVNRIRTTIRSALRAAMRYELVDRNDADAIEPYTAPRNEPTQTKRRALTRDQAAALIEAAPVTRYGNAIVLQLTTGLRPGELLGLPWENVDLETGRLTVDRQLIKRPKTDTHPERFTTGPPKSRRSHRTFDLGTPAIDALRRQALQVDIERDTAAEFWTDHGLVFPRATGEHTDPSGYRHALDRAAAHADLGHLAPYDLRHTFASLLSDEGVPPEQIADLMGHSPVMTLDVYRHQVNDSIDAAADPIERIFT